jgi:hypothetical protein
LAPRDKIVTAALPDQTLHDQAWLPGDTYYKQGPSAPQYVGCGLAEALEGGIIVQQQFAFIGKGTSAGASQQLHSDCAIRVWEQEVRKSQRKLADPHYVGNLWGFGSTISTIDQGSFQA